MHPLLKFVHRNTTRAWLRDLAHRRFSQAVLFATLASGALNLSGCAAFRPIEGIPARFVPDEVKAPTRSGKRTIDLSLLSQTQPAVYHLDAGDVLAVYIEGVIPRPNEFPPINLPHQGEEASPALGYPIPVRPDGTISLPMLAKALPVRGQTVSQVENAVRRAYTVDKKILQSGNERVWVILHRPRQARILVIRQEGVESPASGQPGQVNLGALKRGTGRVVTLSAYKNDVLHALAETGGLPGLDAENTIYVIRGKRRSAGTLGADAWANSGSPNFGGGISGQNTGPNFALPPSGIPPLPGGGYSINPPSSGVAPVLPLAPGASANPTSSDSSPPTPNDASENETEDAGPQTRTKLKSGLHPAVLGFESGDSPKRVTPIAYQQPIPVVAPSMIPNAPAWPPGMVPMNTPAFDSQLGLPPTRTADAWPEMSADTWMGHSSIGDPTLANQNVVKIPVRLAPGEQTQFTERDIILEDGDIVFIESRDTEIFYTGGLLGGGQYTLPRDYDLDVLGAMAIAQAGRATGGATRATGGITAINQDVTISASQAVILRKMPNGTQVPIRVDLYRAVRHPEERVLMQPGDYLILQYTKLEACGAFFERHLLEGALFGVAAAQVNSSK